ncbi:MAG: (d)CMP kinase, partial [Candidatus Aenigmarchaeota archaeon]|nr:(d)CMP kinase [Candidatus Aenigmarchaeota archaeon]
MNITLIGMAGVGKSFIGKKLAKKLNYDFIDVDELIEKNTNLKLQQIIDKFGERYFL